VNNGDAYRKGGIKHLMWEKREAGCLRSSKRDDSLAKTGHRKGKKGCGARGGDSKGGITMEKPPGRVT